MISDIEKMYDDIAYTLFRDKMNEIAKKAANEALRGINLADLVDEVLPGLEGEAFEQIISAGQLIKDGKVNYVSLSHPTELRWENSPDAMAAEF